MAVLAPIVVAVPLLSAAVMAGFGHFVHSRLIDVAGIAAASAVSVLAALLLVSSGKTDLVYWFGGWKPVDGVAIGISFVVEPFGAGLALLAGVLVTATFAFSWRYFDEVGVLFHVLVLVFLAAMVGFALTGDIFNLFVFFELMSVAAFALTAYRSDEAAPLQGAFNFAVSNTAGAFLILFGIALLYGRTGVLNLAELGEALSGHRPDGLIVTAFVLITSGFLVKAAAVPFHFWLADAYAVAPAPVCVLFSAVMSDLGLYAVAKIYWTVFSGPFGIDPPSVRGALLAMGVLTALVGGAMSFLQRHLKRMLAFATTSHIGLFLIGIALLAPRGLAGSAIYLLADGLIKGGLFLVVGLLIYRLDRGDELALHGRGRLHPFAGVVFALGGLGLAGIPPFGTFLGKALIEESANALGYGWVAWILLLAELLTGAAVLRAAGRIFLGWGADDEPWLTKQRDDTDREEPDASRGRSVTLMTVPAAILVAAGLAIGFIPQLGAHAEQAARRFEDRPAYARSVLHPEAAPATPSAGEAPRAHTGSYVFGVGSTLGAVALALVALFHRRLPDRLWSVTGRIAGRPVDGLRALHSGQVGDYVAWLTAGVGLLGALFALTLT